MENKVVAGQLVVVNKVIRIISSHQREMKKDAYGDYSMSDGVWNGCVEMLEKEIKELRKSLKRQL